MYVFVTVAELSGEDRERELGELPEITALADVKDIVLSQVDAELPTDSRDDPRHFWHNERLCPYDRTLLADLASDNDVVSLELRPDLYYVSMPGEPRARFAIDPELTVSNVIRSLLQGRHGAECCYELSRRDGSPLDPHRTLLVQEALPHQTDLALKRKPIFYVWSAALLGIAAVLGLLLGYLSGGMF